MAKLIILRGNSGSGKTTIAKRLQREFGRGTLLLSQDVIRRDMLCVRDDPDNPAVDLLRELILYGNRHSETVILEGILTAAKYKKLFDMIKETYKDCVYAYYFNISFAETLERHKRKPNAHEFGEEEMRRWWIEKDYLGIIPEKELTQDMNEEQVVQLILRDVRT